MADVTVEAILIAGPTASGKSRLASDLAKKLGGLVVNADSMQVYRDLRIITARPTPDDEAEAPHALYGMVDAADTYSVSRWLADTRATLLRAQAERRLPILVGGTGLYFKALTQGLSDIPDVPAGVRNEIRAWAAGRPAGELHATLVARDPATAARLRPTDPQRLIRALEVHAATGESLAMLQGRRAPPLLAARRCVAVSLAPDRGALRARIEARFDDMMAAGALDEVRGLAARGLDRALPLMRAHGVSALLRHIAGLLDLEAAIAEGKADTRRYVKRQATFVRHQLPDFVALAPEDAVGQIMRDACTLRDFAGTPVV